MTIFLEHYGKVPTVVEGFANPLEFQFRLYHSEGDPIFYEPLGSYDIKFYVSVPNMERAYLARGFLADTSPLLQEIHSRPNQAATWAVQIDVPTEVIGRIDAAKRLSSARPVDFHFEWGLLVQRCVRTREGTQRNEAPKRERVMQPTEGGSSAPMVVPVAIEEWFKITEAFGFPRRRFLEMAFPEVDKGRWQQAAEDISHADRDFELRNDKQALDYCEQALENVLGRQIVTATQREKAKQQIAVLLESWGVSDQRKREMLSDLIDSCVVFTRRGKHDASAAGHPEFDPNSGDAELGLLVTKSLLGYLSKQRTW